MCNMMIITAFLFFLSLSLSGSLSLSQGLSLSFSGSLSLSQGLSLSLRVSLSLSYRLSPSDSFRHCFYESHFASCIALSLVSATLEIENTTQFPYCLKGTKP